MTPLDLAPLAAAAIIAALYIATTTGVERPGWLIAFAPPWSAGREE